MAKETPLSEELRQRWIGQFKCPEARDQAKPVLSSQPSSINAAWLDKDWGT